MERIVLFPIGNMKTLRFILAALAIGAALYVGGCAKKDAPPISTGSVLPAALVEVQFRAYVGRDAGVWAFTPDSAYAIVSSGWLPGFYERFRADLFAKDVTGWEGRFDCNKFAAAFCAGAQVEFYRDNFQSRTPAQALAVGEVWYQPERRARPGDASGHAIVAAITERGVVFIEPQTGQEVRMTPGELASIYFKRF
jgi:hypothetical protein